jgi:hypothetical protein
MGQHEVEFQTYFPNLTEQDARSTIRPDGEVVSFNHYAGVPDLFIVRFATRTRRFEPMALNPAVARLLLNELRKHVAALPT